MVNINELQKENYKSGELAKMVGVTTRTIQKYCAEGKIEEKLLNNRRLIPREAVIKFLKEKELLDESVKNRKDIIYARVSTHKQKNRGDLERQIRVVKDYVIYRNPYNLEIIQEVGSGLNDNRKGLLRLLKMVQNNEVERIFVNYKDRLTRFGYNYIKVICDYYHTEIVVISDEVEDKSVNEELAEDIVAIIHSFSGKLDGMRRIVREEICKELNEDETGRKSCDCENT